MKGFSRIVITAGPTREKLDSVRFISNFSTGNMGYELARASLAKGYDVTLISGPTHLGRPKGARFVPVEDAREMEKAVRRHLKRAQCLFMSSAVSDWRPARRVSGKLKKNGKRSMRLDLVKNPDILAAAGRAKNGKLLAGFALESKAPVKNAREKLQRKNLDMIVANRVGKRSPFGMGKTDVVIIDRNGGEERIANATKRKIAGRILQKAEELWAEGR